MSARLTRYDGAYYTRLATDGYPHTLPTRLGSGNSTGFFPGYSLAIRGLSALTHVDVVWTAFLITLLAGAFATVVVAIVATELSDARTGLIAAVTWTVLPTSYLLSTDYSEALFVLLSACALVLLLRRRPLVAGVVAASAAVVRPVGLAFVIVLAVESLRQRSTRTALGAVVAASLPTIHLAYLAHHTGQPDAWWRSERIGWGAHFDAGLATAKMVVTAALHPMRSPWFDTVALTIVVTLVLLWLALRDRLALPAWSFCAVVLGLALTSGVATYGSYPRIAYTAVPLLVPLARRIGRLAGWLKLALVGVSVVTAAALGTIVAVSHAVIP